MGDEIIRTKRDPERAKKNSLEKDNRNSYGESPHAARKAIPKRKAMAHRHIRHATKQELNTVDLTIEEEVDLVESNARNDVHKVGTWKKMPDRPLGEHIEQDHIIREFEDGKITLDEKSKKLDELYRHTEQRNWTS